MFSCFTAVFFCFFCGTSAPCFVHTSTFSEALHSRKGSRTRFLDWACESDCHKIGDGDGMGMLMEMGWDGDGDSDGDGDGDGDGSGDGDGDGDSDVKGGVAMGVGYRSGEEHVGRWCWMIQVGDNNDGDGDGMVMVMVMEMVELGSVDPTSSRIAVSSDVSCPSTACAADSMPSGKSCMGMGMGMVSGFTASLWCDDGVVASMPSPDARVQTMLVASSTGI